MEKRNLFTTGSIEFVTQLTPDQRIFLYVQNQLSIRVIISLFKNLKKVAKLRKNTRKKKRLQNILLTLIHLILFKQSPILTTGVFILQKFQKKKLTNILMGGMYWSSRIDEYGNKKLVFHTKEILVGIVLPILFSTLLYTLCQSEKRLHIIPLRTPILPELPRVYQVACENIGNFNSLLVYLMNTGQKYNDSSLRYKSFVIRLCLLQMFDIKNYSEQTLNFLTTCEGGNLCLYRADLLDYLIDKTCRSDPRLDKVCFDMVRYLAANYKPKVF